MASPNLIAANTILGKTSGVLLANTNEISVLENPASSSKCLKINTLNLANYGNIVTTVTINYHNAASLGGNSFPIAANISVPASSTMNIIDKTSQYYLDENTSIGARAAGAGNISVTVSYEDIS
jgi:hypothetical protein